MKELNKSVVFKLRPSSTEKVLKEKEQRKTPKNQPDEMIDDLVDHKSNTLNLYLSKPPSSLSNRDKEFASPVLKKQQLLEDDPVIQNIKVGSGSRNNKGDNLIAKSLNLTQSFSDLLHNKFTS
jgi:hypothetical protein